MNHWAFICAGALVFASLLASSSAQAAVLVRGASDLTKDAKVANLVDAFRALSAANVVYDQCKDTYNFTPEQIAFERAAFTDVSKQYVQAFHDAYTARVGGYEPDQAMVNDYVHYATEQQRAAVTQTTQMIQQKGCSTSPVYAIANYVAKLQNADRIAKANAVTQQQQTKRAVIPDSPMESKPATPQVITPTTDTSTPTPGSH